MKKIAYGILMLAAGLFTTSCLDEDPQYSQNSKIIFSNEENAELFNEYFTFELSYIPDNTRVASLFSQVYFDEDLYYWDPEIQGNTNGGYSTEPIIKFDIDASEFSIESYFSESNFGSIVDSVEDLGDIYEGYFPYCFGY